MTVFEKIEAQQKGKENTGPWMVGEQLKEICRSDPHCAELVDKDLDNKSRSLEAAEKQINAWADQQKKGSSAKCVCVPPNVAEGIIRKFYGLPEKSEAPQLSVVPFTPPKKSLELADLL